MQITIEIDNGIFNKIAVSGGSLEENPRDGDARL